MNIERKYWDKYWDRYRDKSRENKMKHNKYLQIQALYMVKEAEDIWLNIYGLRYMVKEIYKDIWVKI